MILPILFYIFPNTRRTSSTFTTCSDLEIIFFILELLCLIKYFFKGKLYAGHSFRLSKWPQPFQCIKHVTSIKRVARSSKVAKNRSY